MMPATARRGIAAFLRFMQELLRQPQSAFGTLLAVFFLILALFGAQLAPYPNPNDQSHDVRLAPTLNLAELWLGDHPFGTDRLGRDVYSRVTLAPAASSASPALAP